jgi:hypothetical protein
MMIFLLLALLGCGSSRPTVEARAAALTESFQGLDPVCAWRDKPADYDHYQCFAGSPHGAIEVRCTSRGFNDCRVEMIRGAQ